MMNLEGKTALVTGASGAIGAEIVRNLHKLGANIVISGTNKSKLDALSAELGSNIFQEVCNLSDKAEVAGLYSKAELHTGKIDILVCNAGITKDNLTLRMSEEDFTDVLNVNLTASFILNKSAVKKMMKQKWGRIINISSIVGVTGNPGQANYCASKAGLIGMTKSIALEIATRGVTVNAIAPGFISTPMTDQLTDDQKEYMKNKIPMKKFGTALDVANITSFLASDLASYITGQTMHVNGGMFMG